MNNIKIEKSWWEQSNDCLYLQCSIDDKLINLIFPKVLIEDIFYATFSYEKEDLEKAKNKVITVIETKDKKLGYFIEEALKDQTVKKQLTQAKVGQFNIKRKHFYSHTNSNGIEICKDYR